MLMNDDELVKRCREDGNRKAFGQLYEKYKKQAYILAYTMTRHHEDASDLLQEAFKRAYENLNYYQLGTNFRAWLLRILHNLCIDHNRTRKTTVPIDNDKVDSKPQPPKLTEAEERKKLLWDAIEKLPEKYNEIVVLFDIEGLRHREISHILNISEGRSRVMLHEARKKLRDSLRKYPEYFKI